MQITSISRQRLGDEMVVASISGHKDSTVVALALKEYEIPHVRVFADTGFEAPETYAYLDRSTVDWSIFVCALVPSPVSPSELPSSPRAARRCTASRRGAGASKPQLAVPLNWGAR